MNNAQGFNFSLAVTIGTRFLHELHFYEQCLKRLITKIQSVDNLLQTAGWSQCLIHYEHLTLFWAKLKWKETGDFFFDFFLWEKLKTQYHDFFFFFADFPPGDFVAFLEINKGKKNNEKELSRIPKMIMCIAPVERQLCDIKFLKTHTHTPINFEWFSFLHWLTSWITTNLQEQVLLLK